MLVVRLGVVTYAPSPCFRHRFPVRRHVSSSWLASRIFCAVKRSGLTPHTHTAFCPVSSAYIISCRYLLWCIFSLSLRPITGKAKCVATSGDACPSAVPCRPAVTRSAVTNVGKRNHLGRSTGIVDTAYQKWEGFLWLLFFGSYISEEPLGSFSWCAVKWII